MFTLDAAVDDCFAGECGRRFADLGDAVVGGNTCGGGHVRGLCRIIAAQWWWYHRGWMSPLRELPEFPWKVGGFIISFISS